MDIENSI